MRTTHLLPLSLVLVLVAGCTITHTRRIPVHPVDPPAPMAAPFTGVILPTVAKFTIPDAPEGSLLHLVKVKDRFELAGDLPGTYHDAFLAKLHAYGIKLEPVAAGAPWEARMSDGQYALQATIETVELGNVIKKDGLNASPTELTFNMVTFYRLYAPGEATPFVKFQSGPFTWTTKNRNIAPLLPEILLATADFAVRCLQGRDFNKEPVPIPGVDCTFVGKAIEEHQAKAARKIEDKIAPLEAAGDHAGALLALTEAYDTGCNSRVACDAIFARIVGVLKKLPGRPPLSEEGRRLAIQAESAAKDKRYDDAIELFRQATRKSPWWSDGFFNAALLCGEQQKYADAMMFMGRFVQLNEGTPDARKAQDKIYEWEGKLKAQQAAPPK